MTRYVPRILVCAAASYAVLGALAAAGNNGDLMYLESLYYHLVTLKLPWSNFVFTEAFFFFPDALVYAPLRLIGGGQEVATLLFLIVNLGASAALFDRIYQRTWPRAESTERAAALAFVLIALSFVPRLNKTLFWPNHHGTLLPIFLGLALAFGLRPTARGVLAVIVITAATTLSDGVSLMQVFAPLWLTQVWRRRWIWVLALGLGVAQGAVTLALIGQWGWLRFHPVDLSLSRELLYREAVNLVPILDAWTREAWLFCVITASFVIVGRAVRTGPRRNLIAIDRLFSVSLFVTILTTLGMGRLLSVFSIRYVQNFFYLAAAGTALTILPELNRTDAFRRWFPRTLLIFSLIMSALLPVGGLIYFDHGLRDCVESATRPGDHGLADFWPAKLLMFTGRRVVNQVDADFTKYRWMNSERWYRPGATFFVTHGADHERRVVEHFGRPREVVTCPAPFKVFSYPDGLPTPPNTK